MLKDAIVWKKLKMSPLMIADKYNVGVVARVIVRFILNSL